MDLAQLWVLSDKLGVPSLQNLAMDQMGKIFETHGRLFTDTAIKITKYTYENTRADNVLRRRIVDWWAWERDLEQLGPHLPQQMVLDLVNVLKSCITKKLVRFSMTYSIGRPWNDYHVRED